ncbi:transposase [Geminicoccus flavidas]|uniref:transposase n=1 Tax=Geminicoccus flavidas TaxID=2506407 RepID=UPI0038B25B6C
MDADRGTPGADALGNDWPTFRWFCGLGLEDGVPDATNLSHFRIDLGEAGLAKPCPVG